MLIFFGVFFGSLELFVAVDLYEANNIRETTGIRVPRFDQH